MKRIMSACMIEIRSRLTPASTCICRPPAFRAPNRKSSPRVRSAPTLGSLLGASGSFFWLLGGGMTRGSFWAKAATGTAAMTAAVIAIRQLRAPGNLKAIRQV